MFHHPVNPGCFDDRSDFGKPRDREQAIACAWMFFLALMLLLGFGCLYSAFAWTQYDAPGLRMLLSLLVMVLFLVLSRRTWAGGLLLAMVQADLLLHEPTSGGEIGRFFAAFAGLLLVLAACRVHVLGKLANQFSLKARIRELAAPLNNRSGEEDPVRPGLLLLTGSGLRGILAVSLALLLLAWVPVDPSSVREFRLTPNGYRAVTLGLWLGGGYLVVSALLGAWCWRRLSPSQAEVYLGTSLVGWLHRDLRLIVKRRMKEQQRSLSTARMRQRHSAGERRISMPD